MRALEHSCPYRVFSPRIEARTQIFLGGRMQPRLFAPRYWLTWAGLGVLRLLAMLPFPALLATGRVIGAIVRHLPIGFVRTARRNIELCFPELDEPARERLLNQHFASLGMALT